MSIVRFRRVSIHPWLGWMVVKKALVGFTQGQNTGEGRRTVASILKTLDDALDPEALPIENPYLRITIFEAERRKRRNEEILRADPANGRQQPDRIEGDRILVGFKPLPAPDMRVTMDFSPDAVRVVKNALEAFAEDEKIPHDLDQAITDAIDAFEDAEPVEVETGAARKPRAAKAAARD